jgi:glycosyltransferase involved in cell wall biosynthesis
MLRAPLPVPALRMITRLNVGGPARQALLLSGALEPEYSTTLAAGRPSAAEGELSHGGVTVRYLPLVRPLRPAHDARALVAARSLLSQTGARLLHTHTAKAGTVGRLAALGRPDLRTVHTFHGHVLDGYFGPRVQRAFVEVERRLARHTDVLIAVSPEIRDELLELRIGRPSQYEVVPVGLDLTAFLAVTGGSGRFRATLGLGGDVPLVGAVGRLVPIKDLETLLAAMTTLPGVHLAVVGDGDQRPALQARATALGLDRRVHFTGWAVDVAEVMADLDVVVLTSRNEGTPVSLIETAACGRPVVATRVGGVATVVLDGVTGWLAPPGSPDEIGRLIRRLLDDPAARRRMGEAGRAHVRRRFGSERLVRDIRALYGELVARPPARRGGAMGPGKGAGPGREATERKAGLHSQ